ncbi:RtcB family protein [bacterium]
MQYKRLDDYRILLPQNECMRTNGLIFVDEKILKAPGSENAFQQVANVACLPGIVGYSLGMPDIHWGYGFPIGGVAAFDYDHGIISPGGIGYDINCGVRLVRTNLTHEDIKNKSLELINMLFQEVPAGIGCGGKIRLSKTDIRNVLTKGAYWAVENGYGLNEDLDVIEDYGKLETANANVISPHAIERGLSQLGTLGAGNHFLEIQKVVEIYDEQKAANFGLLKDAITIMIHTGSRGLGYQVCDDFIRVMRSAVRKYNIHIPDSQLACAPFTSSEGQEYFAAMSCAANYAWANRQCIMHSVRQSFQKVLHASPNELGMGLVYDVAHNIGKIENHNFNGKDMKLIVHRKGATRAFPGNRIEVPQKYKSSGQPVLVPGTMGSCSYVLAGTEKALNISFGSTCHGAGRVMSRTQALKKESGRDVERNMQKLGITIKTAHYKTLAEEAPYAYKDVNNVVNICHNAGLAIKVARMEPLAVIKG